jgi:ABC-type uncharacterized transport system auxiliary subunit
MIEVMVKVSAAIINGADSQIRKRELFRRARKGLDEVLNYFGMSHVAKSYQKQVDCINETIVGCIHKFG